MKIGLQLAMPSEFRALPGASSLTPFETVSGVDFYRFSPDIIACTGGVGKVNAAMAAENLMLRAVDLGLGTCAIKSYNEAAVRKVLRLPDTARIELLVTIGYPEGEPRCPARKPMEEVLFWNGWKENV